MKDGKINNNSGKDLLEKLARSNDDVNSLIESMDLAQESSEDLLSSIIDKVLDDNPDEVKRLLNGEVKLISFFMGQVMKETKGKGNPKLINKILLETLVSNNNPLLLNILATCKGPESMNSPY